MCLRFATCFIISHTRGFKTFCSIEESKESSDICHFFSLLKFLLVQKGIQHDRGGGGVGIRSFAANFDLIQKFHGTTRVLYPVLRQKKSPNKKYRRIKRVVSMHANNDFLLGAPRAVHWLQ
jgi:hypothetical protein